MITLTILPSPANRPSLSLAIGPQVGRPGPIVPGGLTGQLLAKASDEDGDVAWVDAGEAAGVEGPQGPAGPAGADGAEGPQGPAGPAGADGATGPQGPAGPAGADGATGPQGPAGPAGADGATGPQGPAGPAGADGATGPQGPAGADGATGPQGPAGADGATGPQGPAGADGATGPQGPAGADGATGPQGPAGADGVDCASLVQVVTLLGGTLLAESGPGLIQAQTAQTLVDNRANYQPVLLKPGTYTGVACYCRALASYTGDNYNGVALYSYDGDMTLTKLQESTNSASAWVSAAANRFLYIPFAAPVVISTAGIYFIATLYNNSAQTTAPQLAGYTNLSNGGIAVVPGNEGVRWLAQRATQASLPASENLTTLSTSVNMLWLALY